MRTIRLFVYAILSVLLISKVTLAQSIIKVDIDPYIYVDNGYEEIYGWHFMGGLSVEAKKSQYFNIYNLGDSPLTISDIHIVGEGFKLTNNETTITIEPKEIYHLFIEFAPIKVGSNYGTITFKHSASNLSSPFSVPLTGTGLPFGTPQLDINGAHLILFNEGKELNVGKTEQSYLLISNTGTAPLVISSIDITPYHGDDVMLTEMSKAFSLPNGETTITIEPGNTYKLIVEFKPTNTRAKSYQAILLLTHNGKNSGTTSSPTKIYLIGYVEENNITATDEPAELPTAYSLSQNYPNPFNPTTKIEYSLLEATNVRLAVYNNLGQEVANLVDEYKAAGKYIVDFNANNLPSGIYFYKIQAGNFNKTQKMVLMK